MRRLPVYLLLDTSFSMRGKPIEAIKEGVETMVSTLRRDPYALETVFLSVLTFNSTAQQLVPLTDIMDFRTPDMVASGTTALGEALSLLSNKMDTEVVKSTMYTKGDWKPLIFLMTDGGPTGAWKKALNELKKRKVGLIVACATGRVGQKHLDNLKRISEIVLQLSEADSVSIKSFFKWVSSSVSAGSQQICDSDNDIYSMNMMPPLPSEIKYIIDIE
jgi:uncharacterized protein YegL